MEYPKVSEINVGGVIPFNRYGADDPEQRKRRLIYDLLDEDDISFIIDDFKSRQSIIC